jgi:hypothetical protein
VLLPFVTIRIDVEAASASEDGVYQLSYAGHDMLWDGRPDLLLRQDQDGDPSNGLEEFRFENVGGAYMFIAPRIEQQPWLYAVAVLVCLGAAAAALPRQWLRAVISAATALPAALAMLAATVLARQGLIGALHALLVPEGETPPVDLAGLVHLGYGFWLALALLTIVGLGNVWFAVPGRPVERAAHGRDVS